jgi:hypothetical protein
LYKWILREVEVWVLRAAPRQPEEEKNYHGTMRDMITASSNSNFLSPKGDVPDYDRDNTMFRNLNETLRISG